MDRGWKRWAPPVVIVAAGLFLAFVAPVVDPPPEGAEPIFTMAALGLFGFVLLPITLLLSAMNKAPTVRWIMAATACMISLLLTAGG